MSGLEFVRDNPTTQRNFEKLAAQFLDTGGQSIGIRFGTQVLSWAGGTARTGSPTISHGLGRVPQVVFVTPQGSPSSTWFPIAVGDTLGATTFVMRGVTSDNSSPAAATTTTVAWMVIG